MARLKLFGGNMTAPLEIPLDGQPVQTLTDWVRGAGVPLYWRCGHGTCGACAVHLRYPADATPRWISLSGKERNVLRRHGRIDEADYQATQLEQTPSRWRLGCHVTVQPDEDLDVSW